MHTQTHTHLLATHIMWAYAHLLFSLSLSLMAKGKVLCKQTTGHIPKHHSGGHEAWAYHQTKSHSELVLDLFIPTIRARCCPPNITFNARKHWPSLERMPTLENQAICKKNQFDYLWQQKITTAKEKRPRITSTLRASSGRLQVAPWQKNSMDRPRLSTTAVKWTRTIDAHGWDAASNAEASTQHKRMQVNKRGI